MPTVCTSKRSFGNRRRREIFFCPRRSAGHYRKRGSRKANIELEDLNRFRGELHRLKERGACCIACSDGGGGIAYDRQAMTGHKRSLDVLCKFVNDLAVFDGMTGAVNVVSH